MSYDVISSEKELKDYCKYKRKNRMVIFDGDLLPLKCAVCGETIKKDDGNRVKLDPENTGIKPMHYKCSWDDLFNRIAKLTPYFQ